MKITFSQPVKKSTVITASGSPSVDFLNDTNVAFTSLESPAKNIAIGTTAGTSAEASLSADGKTLTIMAGGNDVFEGRYQLIVQNVENTNSDKIEKYDEIVNLGKDTVAPTVKSVEKVNAATHKITFSEPVNTKGNFTYKLADGTVIPSADIVDSALSADGKSLTLTINSDKMATYSGKTIQVTLLGTTDFARNVITPNPVTFNIAVGEEDGIAPTVSSVKALSDTKIEVVFSEEVQGFNDTNAGNLTLTGTNIASGVKGFSVKQDKVDKKKYVVTLDQSALSSVDSAVADLKIVKANIVDLSGEKMKDDYTAIVTIKKDTVAPKLVSTNVVKDANGQWLELKFDKELDPTVGTAVAVNGTNATAYKNYVTETGDFAFGGTNDKLTTDKDGVKIKLADAKFKTADLVDGTKYTFDVDVKGANGVTTTTPIEISFTYNEQASSDKPEVTKNGIAVSQLDNGTITITFNKELDGSSATNTSNYTIPGVQIKSATLKPFDATAQTQDVVLRLGDNDLTGNRNITISGVRSKAGIVMDSKTDVVNLIENINPTMASAKVTGTKTIDVTFSEAITGTGISDKDDFEIKVGDTVVAYGTTANGLSADGKVVTITLDNALTATDLDKAITIKSLVGGTSAIGDTSTPANTIKSSTITVAK